MKLDNKLLSSVALGLSLAVASCDTGQPVKQQPETQGQHPAIGREDTGSVPVLRNPDDCPACGMG
ncbi:MAG: hypothetical protein BGO31_02240 [Bacteroidetes bacterium 43-16]|nr:MAG: hypothetical protein BGO31_02240 [Bacteroidetes bacterium 43-16]